MISKRHPINLPEIRKIDNESLTKNLIEGNKIMLWFCLEKKYSPRLLHCPSGIGANAFAVFKEEQGYIFKYYMVFIQENDVRLKLYDIRRNTLANINDIVTEDINLAYKCYIDTRGLTDSIILPEHDINNEVIEKELSDKAVWCI